MEGIATLRKTLILGFVGLPILLITFIAFLATAIGNAGLFILLAGQVLVVPLVVGLVRFLTGKVGAAAPPNSAAHTQVFLPHTDRTQLVPSLGRTDPEDNVAPTYWMAQVIFFMTYLISNASALKELPRSKYLADSIYEARATKANLSMVISIFVLLALVVLKFLTGTETVGGIAIAAAVAVPLGYGWYRFAVQCGLRNTDIFGIVSKQPPMPVQEKKRTMCFYDAKA